MKIFTRWLLTLALVAVPMMAVINTASANTEMVPASRLVAPYLTVGAGKSTFMLITNTSATDMQAASAAFPFSVHLEFYARNCVRRDRSIHLSPFDIDQVNVTASDFATGTDGFVDIDVRRPAPGQPFPAADLGTSTSARINALMGEVVITDVISDYTLSYPMASSLGSSTAVAVGGQIVTRDVAGAGAVAWTGRYEPFPTTVMLPGFYAEGGAGAGSVGESLLAIASPADGNWYGFCAGQVGTAGCGEAPGQQLAVGPPATLNLINIPQADAFDGCEENISRLISGHYVAGSLTTLFGTPLDRDAVGPGPWTLANCNGPAPAPLFPGLDELAAVPVGWIRLPNITCVRSANFNFPANVTACSGGVGTAAATTTAAKRRGVVGVFFEAAEVLAPDSGADTARLWGDTTTITNQAGCFTSGGAARGCAYSFTTQAGTIPTFANVP